MAKRWTALDRQVQRLVKHAYNNAPAVKKILDDCGVRPTEIKSVADLERIPVTHKDRLIQYQRDNPPFGGFLAVHPRRLKRIFLSPGPLHEPYAGEKALDQTLAGILRVAGFRRGEIALNTLSYHLSPGGWLLDGGLRRAGVCTVPGGVGSTELQVRTLLDLNVAGYVGTPSFLMTLIKKAEEMGMDFPAQFALRHTLFTAEPYPPSLRSQFQNTYGLKTTNAYATGELGFLAYECEKHSGLHFADNVVIELVDPATGDRVGPEVPGEIVATTFNETYPILRLGTGDLATYTDQPCACGRASHRLLGLLGRVGEAIKVRGMFVHPNQLKAAFAKSPEVARGRGVVTRSGIRDELALEVECADSVSGSADWQTALRESVRELCRVTVDSVVVLPTGTLPADGRVIVDERKWD